MIDKAVRIELTKYEQPDFYDRFARALDECLTKAMDGLNALAWATGCALSAVAAMFLIARVDPVILVFSLPSIIASFMFSSRINTLQYELRTQETRDKRTAEYVKRVFYEKKYAGEIRLYDIRKVLMREHKESYDSRYELYVTMYRRIHMLRAAAGAGDLCFADSSGIYLCQRCIKDDRSGEDRSVCGNTGKY